MILAGIKKRSAQKLTEKQLKKLAKAQVVDTKINTVLVLLPYGIFSSEALTHTLAQNLQIKEENVVVVSFLPKQLKEMPEVNYFTKKSYKLSGKIKDEALKKWIETNFDVLINLDAQNNPFIDNVTAMSKAHFKVAFAREDERFFDLMIDCNNNVDVFVAELKKYLSILNKIA